MIGYKSINNNIVVKLLNKYLKEYHDNLLLLYADINDDIINKVNIINSELVSSEYMLYDIIKNKNIEDTIIYIYK